MERTNKRYEEEYKKNIVKLVETGKAIADICREYGLSKNNIYNWKNKYGSITSSDGTVTSNDEINKIKKENRILKEENDILKKAMAIFTKR